MKRIRNFFETIKGWIIDYWFIHSTILVLSGIGIGIPSLIHSIKLDRLVFATGRYGKCLIINCNIVQWIGLFLAFVTIIEILVGIVCWIIER